MKLLACVAIFFFTIAFVKAQPKYGYGWYTEGSNNMPTRRIGISVTNPLDIALKNQPIVVKRKELPIQNIAELWVAVVDPKLPSNPVPTKEDMK